MYACDFILHQDNSDPSYRKQWYTVTKDMKVYCLVPVPVGEEGECLSRAQELVMILNQRQRFTVGTPYSENHPCNRPLKERPTYRPHPL